MSIHKNIRWRLDWIWDKIKSDGVRYDELVNNRKITSPSYTEDGLLAILRNGGGDIKDVHEALKDNCLMDLLQVEFGCYWRAYTHLVASLESMTKKRDNYRNICEVERQERIKKHETAEAAKSKKEKDAEKKLDNEMSKLDYYDEIRHEYEKKKKEAHNLIYEMKDDYWGKYNDYNKKIGEINKGIDESQKTLISRSNHSWLANVHLLRGYGDSYDSYKEMVGWLRETFPKVKDKDITISKISKSSCVDGFSMISFCLNLPQRKEFEGWSEYEDGLFNQCPEYNWN